MYKEDRKDKRLYRLTFGSYIKRHLAVLVVLGLITITFFLILSLYSLPLDAVLYAAILSAVGIVLIGIFRYHQYSKRVQMLERLKNCILVSMKELPEPRDIMEKDYQELLKIVNSERTAAISQKDKMISDMIDYYSIWAHQIKTPIAALRLMPEVEQNTEVSEQLFKIEQYVEMVLGYIRTESMSGDLVIKRCNLDEIIKQSVRKYSKQFIRKKLSLRYSNTDIQVTTDSKWLGFIIEQLLSNAVKYTQRGYIEISAKNEAETAKGEVSLTISDTGIGIPAEDIPRLGEKGFTGYNGHEDRKSTGIGLYLCRKTAEKLSLSIIFTSVPGEGTKVTIRGL